ncbi:MAG: bioA [Gammaproteobacteria bacterium]|jgi:adenosylmethionine-8-amino-7-oxononanoate aminotransferase|nr:bioA [Gammaproteobacteria bacterium]
MNTTEIQALDLKYNWHPGSQMKDYEQFKPLVIRRAYGSYIELDNGRKVIDAISSWWCKSLGHNHPVLRKNLMRQLEKFEHVIFANTTHETIAKLSQTLGNLMPTLNKVFYTGDGSCAVEVAMKMSLHFRVLQGDRGKTKFIALKNGYHGETIGALSVSDMGLYRDPYASILFEPILIEPLYVSGKSDPQWDNAKDYWKTVENTLEVHKDSVTAIICEPILQGAGGMRIYSQDFLYKLGTFAKANNIHLIADEIMTGIGRTGKMLACEHAAVIPHFICLSKGLTSGWIPFSAVLTTQEIYQAFYDDYEKSKSFLHSHTYSGNALGASLALSTLEIIKKEDLCGRANRLQTLMQKNLQDIAEVTGSLTNIRGIGGVVAADLINQENIPRLGYKLSQEAVKLGALLRPLGNTIYWMPPLNIAEETLEELKDKTLQAILNTQKRISNKISF